MHVLVHTGMPKTGSSALQSYLADHRESLAAAGIDYPDYGHRSHWRLSAALAPTPQSYHHARRRSDPANVGALVDQVRRRLSDTLRAGASNLLILSHEDLSVQAQLRGLEAMLTDHGYHADRVTYVSYVRHPTSVYSSAVQQSLKSDLDRSFVPTKWVSAHIQRAERATSLLGDQFHMRPFAPPNTPGWDVIEDFRTFCRRSTGTTLPEPGKATSVNTALSAEACAVLELGRRRFRRPALARAIRKGVRRFDETWTGRKLTPPAEWLKDIANANATRWNDLILRFDTDPETRESLRIAPVPSNAVYSDADVHKWLVEGLSADWLDAFLAALQDQKRSDATLRPILRWLTELRESARRHSSLSRSQEPSL